jgi:hypothetical protein
MRPDPDASLSKLIFDRTPPSQPASDEKLKRSGQPNMKVQYEKIPRRAQGGLCRAGAEGLANE